MRSSTPRMAARGWWPGAARLAVALLAALTGWAAAWSWAPLYSAPHRYLAPSLAVAVLVAVAGAVGRALRLPVYVVPLAQVALVVLLLATWFSAAASTGGFSTQAVSDLVHRAAAGSGDLNTYTAPVPGRFLDVPVFLACCAAAVTIAVDLFALGLRRVSLAGLPLLLALTVPITVLTDALPLGVFLPTGAAFLALLAAQHTDQLHGWGREVLGDATRDAGRRGSGVSLVAGRIGALALAGAVVLPFLIPVTDGLFNGKHDDSGGNGTRGVTLVNPMIDIRRDLIQKTHTPLVDVHTDDTDPSYVRLSVLDQFTGSEWRASVRKLPEVNRVAGPMPIAPGLSSTQPGRDTSWRMRIEDTFETSWLPTPYPATSIEAPGDWRFDARYLDVVNTQRPSASLGISYRVDAFHPVYDANVLDAAGTPVGQTVENMTDVPSRLPPVIGQVARDVTRGAKTDYQKAIRLQDWFRTEGGFRYSTGPAPGSGSALLAAFVTRDKVGYCEQFAAAMAVMGRTLGIPARVVVGFLRPTGRVAGSDHYLFTSDDLHAWPEFYFGGSGWVHFEPTPSARTGAAPAYTTQQLTPNRPTQPAPTATPGATDTHKTNAPLPDALAGRGGGGGTAAWWWLLVIPVGAVLLLPRLLRSRIRRRRYAVRGAASDVARAAWAELRATALDHQVGWPDGRSPRQALAVLRGRFTHDVLLVSDLDWFAGFVERARYARPFQVDPVTLSRMHEVVASWSRLIDETVSARSRRRATWLPASLLDRTPVDPVVIEEQRVPAGR